MQNSRTAMTFRHATFAANRVSMRRARLLAVRAHHKPARNDNRNSRARTRSVSLSTCLSQYLRVGVLSRCVTPPPHRNHHHPTDNQGAVKQITLRIHTSHNGESVSPTFVQLDEMESAIASHLAGLGEDDVHCGRTDVAGDVAVVVSGLNSLEAAAAKHGCLQ